MLHRVSKMMLCLFFNMLNIIFYTLNLYICNKLESIL